MPILEDIAADIAPFDDKTKLDDVHRHLNVHRQVLRDTQGDLSRTRELVDRMVPEMQEKLRAAQAASGANYVPTGDAGLLDCRYLTEDGMVRLGRTKESITLPDGSTDEVVVHGLLTDIPVVREQAEVQRAYASLATAYYRARKFTTNPPWSDPLVRKSWVLFRKAMQNLPGKTGAFARSMFSDPATMKRVINNQSGTGSNLLTVPTISAVRRPADLLRRLVGLVPTQEVPSESFKRPVVSGRALASKRTTRTDDPARYPVQTFTTSDDTVTVVDQQLMALVDPLWVTSAGNVLTDPMGLVNDWLMRGWADSWEISFLHADTAGTHQDTLASWTVGGYYSAGALDGSTSPLKWWKGFRARAVDDSKTTSAGGSFDASDHFAALETLGVHAGSDSVVAITGLHALYTQLLDLTQFLTTDVFGQNATLLTGELGRIGKTPIIISEFVSNDFDSSSGLYTGSNASTEMIYTDMAAWTYFEMMMGSDDFDVTYPDRGAQYVGAVRRGVLAPTCIDTETPCAILYAL